MRAYLRSIPGVPLVYINRSVMIMEPMADCSLEKRENDELLKYSVGLTDEAKEALRRAVSTGKRQREDGGAAGDEESPAESGEEPVKVAERRKGPRQPNPLSCKKKKKSALPVKFLPNPISGKATTLTTKNSISKPAGLVGGKESTGDPEVQVRKKRKRKHTRSGKALADGGEDVGDTAVMATTT